MLYEEAMLVEQRENQRMASEASLIQMAINGAMSKKGAKEFSRQLKQMQITIVPKIEENYEGEDDAEIEDFSSRDPGELVAELTGKRK